jgi:hypothetical protein
MLETQEQFSAMFRMYGSQECRTLAIAPALLAFPPSWRPQFCDRALTRGAAPGDYKYGKRRRLARRDALHSLPIVSGLLRDGLLYTPATLPACYWTYATLWSLPMLRTAFFVLTAMLSMHIAAAADVYKYVDEKGNVQYTDKPLKLPAERLNVQSQRTDVVSIEERKADESNSATSDKARQTTEKQEAAKREAAEVFEANRIDACNKARADYLSRMGNGRIYEVQPNGERRYLDSAELDVARTAAKEAMDSLCN